LWNAKKNRHAKGKSRKVESKAKKKKKKTIKTGGGTSPSKKYTAFTSLHELGREKRPRGKTSMKKDCGVRKGPVPSRGKLEDVHGRKRRS